MKDDDQRDPELDAMSHNKLSNTLTAAEKVSLLNCRRLPARLDVSQAAAILNFGEHDIRTLCANGLLPPLGKPAPNAPKYFAAAEIVALSENREWLERATKAIAVRWRVKNAKIKSKEASANGYRSGSLRTNLETA